MDTNDVIDIKFKNISKGNLETLKKDIDVNEAMNLLKDLTSIEGGQILSQLNKN